MRLCNFLLRFCCKKDESINFKLICFTKIRIYVGIHGAICHRTHCYLYSYSVFDHGSINIYNQFMASNFVIYFSFNNIRFQLNTSVFPAIYMVLKLNDSWIYARLRKHWLNLLRASSLQSSGLNPRGVAFECVVSNDFKNLWSLIAGIRIWVS